VRHRTDGLASEPRVGGSSEWRRRNGIGSQQRRRQNGGCRYGNGCNLGHFILLLFASKRALAPAKPRSCLMGNEGTWPSFRRYHRTREAPCRRLFIVHSFVGHIDPAMNMALAIRASWYFQSRTVLC